MLRLWEWGLGTATRKWGWHKKFISLLNWAVKIKSIYFLWSCFPRGSTPDSFLFLARARLLCVAVHIIPAPLPVLSHLSNLRLASRWYVTQPVRTGRKTISTWTEYFITLLFSNTGYSVFVPKTENAHKPIDTKLYHLGCYKLDAPGSSKLGFQVQSSF